MIGKRGREARDITLKQLSEMVDYIALSISASAEQMEPETRQYTRHSSSKQPSRKLAARSVVQDHLSPSVPTAQMSAKRKCGSDKRKKRLLK